MVSKYISAFHGRRGGFIIFKLIAKCSLSFFFFCKECLSSRVLSGSIHGGLHSVRVYAGPENTEMTMISSGLTELPIQCVPKGLWSCREHPTSGGFSL